MPCIDKVIADPSDSAATFRCKVVDVPFVLVVRVPQVQGMEETVVHPQLQLVDKLVAIGPQSQFFVKVVDIPVVTQRPFPSLFGGPWRYPVALRQGR